MRRLLFSLSALLLVAALFVSILRSCAGGRRETSASLAQASPGAVASASPAEAVSRGSALDTGNDDEEPMVPDPSAAAEIRSAHAALKAGLQPDQAARRLARLREVLLGLPEQAAAAAIVEFLNGGSDAPSGLPFRVGPDGILQSAPSLRSALLDLLPTLDPGASVEVAREIIAARQSQDEYALALRNLAWNDLDGDMAGELAAGLSSMLGMDPWMSDPSNAFYEAFDVAVELGGVGMVGELAPLVAGPASGARHRLGTQRAAFMALDRIVLRDPSVLVQVFGRDPTFLSDAPRQRAALMSRLDPRKPEQQALLLRYLDLPGDRAEELGYFGRAFPNANYIKGYRLVTSDEEVPSINERPQIDAEMLAAVRSIKPRLISEAGRSAASTIIQRLEKFGQASQHGETGGR